MYRHTEPVSGQFILYLHERPHIGYIRSGMLMRILFGNLFMTKWKGPFYPNTTIFQHPDQTPIQPTAQNFVVNMPSISNDYTLYMGIAIQNCNVKLNTEDGRTPHDVAHYILVILKILVH